MSSNLCALIKKDHTEFVGIEDTIKHISLFRGTDVCLSVQIDTEVDDCIISLTTK